MKTDSSFPLIPSHGLQTECRPSRSPDGMLHHCTNGFPPGREGYDHGGAFLMALLSPAKTDDERLPEKTKGDDYFWQHQHQLEQSALTFTAQDKAETPPMTADNNDTGHSAEDVIPSNRPDINLQASACTGNSGQVLSKPLSVSSPAVSAGFIAVKKWLNPAAKPFQGQKNQDNVASKSNTKGLVPQKVPAILPFKNHQLFLNEGLAELTLNTTQLSNQEARDLQTVIRQWLTQKGYTLKKLIINGVQQ